MKEYTTEFIRNIALASHSSSGKTMLTEAFLHFTGATTRLGRIRRRDNRSRFRGRGASAGYLFVNSPGTD